MQGVVSYSAARKDKQKKSFIERHFLNNWISHILTSCNYCRVNAHLGWTRIKDPCERGVCHTLSCIKLYTTTTGNFEWVRVLYHSKWRVTDHVLTVEAKESGCFAWSWLTASARYVLRRLIETRMLRIFPARSATRRTVMDHRAPAIAQLSLPFMTTFHCTPWTWLGWQVGWAFYCELAAT